MKLAKVEFLLASEVSGRPEEAHSHVKTKTTKRCIGRASAPVRALRVVTVKISL